MNAMIKRMALAASIVLAAVAIALARALATAAEALWMLASGRVKLTQVGADGQEVVIRFLGPGEVLGAVAGFARTTYPVSAEAMAPTRALAWPLATIQELFRSHPELAGNAMRIVSERMRELQERLREMATERVAQRLARALLRLARQSGRKTPTGVLIDLPLSRQELAEMTGTTLFTVSRLLSQWQSSGLVEVGRERIVITSPHGLVEIAEDLQPGSKT